MAYKVKQKKIRYSPFTKNQIVSIGRIEGLSFGHSLKFAEFMKKRFPKEADEHYVREWARRFKTGSPERYMDKKSLNVYGKLRWHTK